MKIKKIADGIYIPEAETKKEELELAAADLMKQYYLSTDNTMREYDPITKELKVISPFNFEESGEEEV